MPREESTDKRSTPMSSRSNSELLLTKQRSLLVIQSSARSAKHVSTTTVRLKNKSPAKIISGTVSFAMQPIKLRWNSKRSRRPVLSTIY